MKISSTCNPYPSKFLDNQATTNMTLKELRDERDRLQGIFDCDEMTEAQASRLRSVKDAISRIESAGRG